MFSLSHCPSLSLSLGLSRRELESLALSLTRFSSVSIVYLSCCFVYVSRSSRTGTLAVTLETTSTGNSTLFLVLATVVGNFYHGKKNPAGVIRAYRLQNLPNNSYDQHYDEQRPLSGYTDIYNEGSQL